MVITCTRRLQFCAGHRVFGHESKCAHLHGHNYVVMLTAQTVGHVTPLPDVRATPEHAYPDAKISPDIKFVKLTEEECDLGHKGTGASTMFGPLYPSAPFPALHRDATALKVNIGGEATLHGDALDDVGRVIDFSVLKARVGGWIEVHWDHGFLLWDKDPLKGVLMGLSHHRVNEHGNATLVPQKLYTLPYNPTAENMARYLLRDVCPQVLADINVRVTHVRVWETENCYADARW